MKKYIIYIGILAAGLFLGSFFFGEKSNNEPEHKHGSVSKTNEMWTCSMHPQIMRVEAGDCPICGMDLIHVQNNSEGLLADQFKLSENAMALANIQTSIVGENISNRNSGLILSGKISENENETATMPAHFDGRIEKLFVKSIGERVLKGQLIAEIYSPELIAAQQELITAYKIKNAQPQLYKAVKNKFMNWMINAAQLKEIEETGKVKKRFSIYSHVSGVVTEITINEGSHIIDGHAIFKVSNLKTVWANFDVYENQIHQFKIGQDVVVNTNAYPNKEFKGKVNFIDPTLNTKTRTVKLRVVLSNNKALFKPGMFVEGEVKEINLNKQSSLIIPSSSVLWTGKRSVVYLKSASKEGVFEMREITLGNKINDNYEVLEGLKNGHEIVTNGAFTVDAAAQLQGKKSMMNKSGVKVMTGHEGHLGMNKTPRLTNKNSFIKKERLKVPSGFQNDLQTVFNDYIKLKDAFVKDDSMNVIVESKRLLDNLSKVNMKKLIDEKAHNYWMILSKEIKITAMAISKTSNIKEQRNHFKHLSTSMINTIQVFGINEKVFVEFCPMANKNNGAYWMSKEEKVINPYFGKEMLTCGEVKQIIE